MSGADSRAFVEVSNLAKRYGSVTVVDNVSFRVEQGKVVALLGPSGCGKTTILRCVAGLEAPDAGSIRIAGRTVDDVAAGLHLPPEARQIGMVFQSYAVWPHMTVFQNVAFPLEVRGRRREVAERVHEALRLVGLDHLAHRPAPMLSGGQQQRVALARALVSQPQVVLFDEPLSNLDARLRERMRFEIANLQQQIGFTAIYVTHDQEEAMALAHEMVLLKDGKVQQQGPPQEIHRNPANAFVAEFVGLGNNLPGTVAGSGPLPETVWVDLADGLGRIAARTNPGLAPGQPVLVAFRPETAQVAAQPLAGYNVLPARVQSVLYLGYSFDLGLSVGGHTVRCRTLPQVAPQVGEELNLCVLPTDCHAIAR